MTFGGPGQATELFSLHIYKAAFISQQLGYSAALSLLLLAIVTALSLGVLLFGNPLKGVAMSASRCGRAGRNAVDL